MTSHEVRGPVFRRVWREAWGRVRCPVVREFLSRFALQMPDDDDEHRFVELLLTIEVDRVDRVVEWQRAAYLADQAVRVFAPIHLEKLGHPDHASEVRALAPLRSPRDFRNMDRVFAHRPWESISQAARSASTWASSLGDAPAPTTRSRRIYGATAAGQAMQNAGAWAEGIEALRTVAAMREPTEGWGGT